MEEVLTAATWDAAGIRPDFESEGVGSHDTVILGTGEMVWFHKQFGQFLDRYGADEVCQKISNDMPVTFGSEIAQVHAGDFAVRMEKDQSNRFRNYLIGRVHSWQSTSERKIAINSIAFFVGREGIGRGKEKRYEPKIKLAELPEGLIPEHFESTLNQTVGSIVLTLHSGVVEPVAVEQFKQPA